MSLTLQVVLALVLGLAAGAGVSASGSASLASLVGIVEPVGTIFVNAIRMTVVPLVVASLIVGVNAAPDGRTVGRLGGRTLLIFVVILTAAGTFAVLLGPPLLSQLPIDVNSVAALRSALSTTGRSNITIIHISR